jgi:hypothetical protein
MSLNYQLQQDSDSSSQGFYPSSQSQEYTFDTPLCHATSATSPTSDDSPFSSPAVFGQPLPHTHHNVHVFEGPPGANVPPVVSPMTRTFTSQDQNLANAKHFCDMVANKLHLNDDQLGDLREMVDVSSAHS